MKLDIQASKAIYEKHKDKIEAKMCYNNIFRMVTYMLPKFQSGEYKVAYGYISICDKSLYARHCFIVCGDSVIDPTIFAASGNLDADYIITKIYDIRDYTKAIEDNDFIPDLIRPLRELDKKLFFEMQEKGIYLIQ
jgi:hypothetical protein